MQKAYEHYQSLGRYGKQKKDRKFRHCGVFLFPTNRIPLTIPTPSPSMELCVCGRLTSPANGLLAGAKASTTVTSNIVSFHFKNLSTQFFLTSPWFFLRWAWLGSFRSNVAALLEMNENSDVFKQVAASFPHDFDWDISTPLGRLTRQRIWKDRIWARLNPCSMRPL